MPIVTKSKHKGYCNWPESRHVYGDYSTSEIKKVHGDIERSRVLVERDGKHLPATPAPFSPTSRLCLLRFFGAGRSSAASSVSTPLSAGIGTKSSCHA
jgi:hypothetical protein